MDIKAAFLNGELEEKIYLEPPKGSDIPAGSILRLCKSLYGLMQSPRYFNDKLKQWLISQGFVQAKADACLFIRKGSTSIIILLVHVDDQLNSSNNRAELDEFKQSLNTAFECSNGGPALYFLGFNIHRDRASKRIFMSQEHYLVLILDRFDMTNCKPAKVPLLHGFKPRSATLDKFEEVKDKPYQAMVGSLLFTATIARPDIASATSLLAEHASRWNSSHLHAARNLLRYIKGTLNLCLTFDPCDGKRILLGYADTDWGGCLDT